MVENTELKISVVIPVYNASQSIVKALDSVKYQTYKCTYQILVVNDGSEDCSKETVEKYILENPQMNITLINQPNGGVSKARNEGLKRARMVFPSPSSFRNLQNLRQDGNLRSKLTKVA